MVLFLFLGLLSAPTRNSPERVRDTIWTIPEKSGKHPGLETPRFSFSQKLKAILSQDVFSLVAPYCAIPRDYLSDTPYCALWGFWCLNMANWVRYPLPLFRAFPPWRACEVEVRYPPPPKRGISAILARYPMKTRQMTAIPPSAILSRKGIAR